MTSLVPGRDRSVFYAPTAAGTWALVRLTVEPATCAGTRPVSGPCRTTAEEAPRECADRKWWLQPVDRGDAFSAAVWRKAGA